MPATTSPEFRFRKFRERAGLSHEEAAQQMGISVASVWDIESFDDEIAELYSPSQVRQFCRVLGVLPAELFGIETTEPPVPATELARLIQEECHSRSITLEQFEDAAGWCLSQCIEPPERLLEDMTVEGLRWLCQELRIDWQRVVLSL